MQLIFAILFGTIVGVSTGIFNLSLIPRLICYIPLGTLAGILGDALANHLEKPARTKNALRQMMYKRLSLSVITFRHGDIISFPGFRAGTTLADISMQGASVMINHDTGGADLRELAARSPAMPYPIQIVRQIVNQGRADQQDMNELALLSEGDWTCLEIGAPEMLLQLRAMGIIPPTFGNTQPVTADTYTVLENANPDFRRFTTANSERTPDISEAVATGEIKSSGKSVSVDDVITRIDEELKKT